MKFFLSGLLVLLAFAPLVSGAELEFPIATNIEPVITAPAEISVEESVVFDASKSRIMSISDSGNPSYSWDFGDNEGVLFGEKVRYEFARPGTYQVRLKIKQASNERFAYQNVLVYNQEAILVTSSTALDLESVTEQAGASGVWLKKISVADGAGLSVEDALIQRFQENLADLERAKAIVFYANSAQELQAFSQFWQRLSGDKRFDWNGKQLVQIADSDLDRLARQVQSVYEVVKPSQIVFTRPEALSVVFALREEQRIAEILEQRGLESQVVDRESRIKFWLPISQLLNFFSAQGLSYNIIYLLLSVPFVAFIIAFFRQFIGVSTFGVFAPLMLTLGFLVLGWQFGLAVFLVVMLVSHGIRLLFSRIDLLYIPKVSLLLSCLALSFLPVLGLAVYFRVSVDFSLAIFPMMMMSTISEKFLSSQTSEGIKSALIAAVETFLVAILAYGLLNLNWMENQILAIPELILLPILGTVWLGRFTGLRVSEYLKFRSLLHEDSQE